MQFKFWLLIVGFEACKEQIQSSNKAQCNENISISNVSEIQNKLNETDLSESIQVVNSFHNKVTSHENTTDINGKLVQSLASQDIFDNIFKYEDRPKSMSAVTLSDFNKIKRAIVDDIKVDIFVQLLNVWDKNLEVKMKLNLLVWIIDKHFLDVEVLKKEFKSIINKIANPKGYTATVTWMNANVPLDMKNISIRYFKKFIDKNHFNLGTSSAKIQEKIANLLISIKNTKESVYNVNWNNFSELNNISNVNEIKTGIQTMLAEFINTLKLKTKITFDNDAPKKNLVLTEAFYQFDDEAIKESRKQPKHNYEKIQDPKV